MTIPAEHDQSESGTWWVSIAFWLGLLLAATLYAIVALAPKLFGFLQLESEWERNQQQLVAMEEQVGYLRRVAAALESDPHFAAELARIEMDAMQPGYERIRVTADLSLDGEGKGVWGPLPETELPWYAPVVELAATDRSFRRVLLGVAAGIILFGFVFLQESQEPQLRSTLRAIHRGACVCVGRYRRPAD